MRRPQCGSAHPAQISALLRVHQHSAVNVRRTGRSGVAGAGMAPERAASLTAAAVPSRGGVAPFFFDMFNIVTGFLFALDTKFGWGRCLSHVGTEGTSASTSGVRNLGGSYITLPSRRCRRA